MDKLRIHPLRWISLIAIIVGIALISFAVVPQTVTAQSPLHPTFPFLDTEGNNVLETGNPISTMQTCGQCHDTAFIESHSFHADVGYSAMMDGEEFSASQPWDTSPGLYGNWNALTYRYLSSDSDPVTDLSSQEWLQTIGLRHVGGGPAEDAGIEMNCFLCHTANPDNQARTEALTAGQFAWANTATLVGSGLAFATEDGYELNPEAFDESGELLAAYVDIQDPDNNNCGQCHGTVHTSQEPFAIAGCEDTGWTTSTTGQVFSAQRLSASGMNLQDKEELTRSYDIHMERLVECTDCHFSLNNPVYANGGGADTLENLDFDPRRLDLGEYLYQPLHQFARGQSTQGTVAPELKDTMRRCESCHNAEDTHDWLPYTETHMDALHCESCHIPTIYSAAYQQVDWTVVETDGTSISVCRGVDAGEDATINDLVYGYTPTLLQRENVDGTTKYAPYNLVSAWYWVYGEPALPVPQAALVEVYLDGENYQPEVISLFDTNQDKVLESSELVLDTDEKVDFIAAKLVEQGLDNPRIQAEVQPYSINHDVAGLDWATQDCETCHTEDSRMTEAVQLASYTPGGVLPEFVPSGNTLTDGNIYQDENGAVYYEPSTTDHGVYVFGHNSVSWIDWTGIILFLGVLGGVSVHGGLRVWSARKRPKHTPEIEKIYMYTFYERVWHWLQTLTILILAFTGLVIHKPEMFGAFSFKGMVLVHNITAAILLLNALLALLYNLISGDIKRFIPEPHGFFNQMIVQAKYYLNGIFKGDEHPFEKTREKRLNPLQKITYVAVLNILLPLQVLTGILMWGVQQFPEIAQKLGGLPFLAPFHSLIAWSFISFIILHVYLTTTGHTPTAGIKSMIVGWDEVEVHTSQDHTEEE